MNRHPHDYLDIGLVALVTITIFGLLLWLALNAPMLVATPVMTI